VIDSHEFILGDFVYEKLTGFKGTIIGMSHYLHSVDQAEVQPHEMYDGKPADPVWFPVGRLLKMENKGIIGFQPDDASV